MKVLSNIHISKIYIKTKRTHSNRPNELDLVNVDVKPNDPDDNTRISVVLDSEEIGSIPYSENNKVFKTDDGRYNVTINVIKPINLSNVPFRYEMKMYDLFGRTFEIEGGNKNE